MASLKKIIFTLENLSIKDMVLIFIVIGFIVYFRVIFNGFVWDDNLQILDNPFVHDLTNIPLFFTGSTFPSANGGLIGQYYRPLMPISFSFLYVLGGGQAIVFHFFDLFLHILNTILIFMLFKKVFSLRSMKYKQTISFLLALIFLVHPVNVESVAFISATELMYTCFFLAAMLLIFSITKEKIRWKRLLIINTMLLLSLFSKESAMAGIIILATFVTIFARKQLKIILPSLLATLGVYSFLRFGVAQLQPQSASGISSIEDVGIFFRILQIPYELFSYIRLVFFPKDLHIAQYELTTHFFDAQFFVYLLVVIGIFILVILALTRYKSPLLLFFSIWIVVSMVLFLNIIPTDMVVAERWMYLPLIGILGFLGVIFYPIIQKYKRFLPLFLVIYVVIFASFSLRTFIRLEDWKSDNTLFTHDSKYGTNSQVMASGYGTILFNEGRYKESIAYFKKALTFSPSQSDTYFSIGLAYGKIGDISKSEKFLYESIYRGEGEQAYENLAALYYEENSSDKALALVQKSISLYPQDPNLYALGSLILQKLHKDTEAQVYQQKAQQIAQENGIQKLQILLMK